MASRKKAPRAEPFRTTAVSDDAYGRPTSMLLLRPCARCHGALLPLTSTAVSLPRSSWQHSTTLFRCSMRSAVGHRFPPLGLLEAFPILRVLRRCLRECSFFSFFHSSSTLLCRRPSSFSFWGLALLRPVSSRASLPP